MHDRTQMLLTAPPFGLLMRLAAPNSIAFLIQSGVSLTEVWFIGKLGTTSLATIALVFPLLMLTQMMSGGALGGGVASSVARAVGAGDHERAERLVWHAIAYATAGAVLFLILFLLAGEQFLGFLGGKGNVLSQASLYCLVLFTGGIFIWLLGVLGAVFRGMGNMQFPARIMVLGAFLQVPLSGTLILGAFGAPQLGVVGAAVSAVVASLVTSGLMIYKLSLGGMPVNLTRAACTFSRDLFADISKVTVPASLSPLLTVATIISLTAIVGSFGEQALAGYGIGSRIEFLMVPLIFGLGAAMMALVGMAIGATNVARAEHVGWIGGAAAGAMAGIIGVTLAMTTDSWIPLFSTDEAIHASAKSYIQIVGPYFAFQGLGLSLYFAAQGAGFMFWPVFATCVRIVLAIGGALLLAFTFELGLNGVYHAAGLAMAMYGVIIAGSLKLGAWRS